MSRSLWVISDTHFNHENIIKYGERPFSSLQEMNETLVENWNKTVKDGDIVYHLGDVYMGERPEFLSKLKGRKRLIIGNHDNGKDALLQRVFQKIYVWRMFPEFGLLLTHVPVHPNTLKEKCSKNIHGHIHQKEDYSPAYVNVSVERVNYTPVNLEELRVT